MKSAPTETSETSYQPKIYFDVAGYEHEQFLHIKVTVQCTRLSTREGQGFMTTAHAKY